MIRELDNIAKKIITKIEADIVYLNDNNNTMPIVIRNIYYIKHFYIYGPILKIIDKFSSFIMNLIYSPKLKGYEPITVFYKLFDIIYERISKMYDIKICSKPEVIWDVASDEKTVIGCGVTLDSNGEETDNYVVVCCAPNMIKYISNNGKSALYDISYNLYSMILNSILKSNDIYNGVDYKQQQERRIDEYISIYNIDFDIIDLCKFITSCRKLMKIENRSSEHGFYKQY